MRLRIDKREPVFLVLEARWSEAIEDRTSVRPFVEGLCGINEWEYFYRVFDSANDLRFWIERFGRLRRPKRQKIVYLACHGERGALKTVEEKIPLPRFLAVLAAAPQIVGVHLGCCDLEELARRKVVRRLLRPSRTAWLAAYRRSIPWLESTVLDLLFLNWLFAGAPQDGREVRLDPLTAATRIYQGFALAREFGFHVMARVPGPERIACSWRAGS